MSASFNYAAQPQELVTVCNLCGRDRFETFAERDRYGLPVKSVACLGCTLVFLSPRMTPAAYREFYRNGHYRELLTSYYGRQVDAETIQAEQAAYAERLVRLLEPHLAWRGAKSLLDVGGSTGVVAEAVAKCFELEATILEPSEVEAKKASDRGLRVMLGTLEDYRPTGEQFDVVLLCQTVDHLTDISAALHTIRGLLADGGLFFMDIVDYRVPYRKVGREGAIKVDHPFYLEPWTAEEYLERAGFERLHSVYDADGLHVNFVCGVS